MKVTRFLCLWASLIFFANTFVQGQNNEKFYYDYSINLNLVNNDQISVSLLIDSLDKEEIIFQFPAIVPGTYKVYDFGRFISQFKAFDQNNNLLPVEQLNVNQWKISSARQLRKITYMVDDTWDTLLPHKVFEPAGTNIEKDKVFVLNNHGFFGYFDGLINTPFKININRSQKYYGSTSLKRDVSNSVQDVFWVENYHRLVDNPIMYAEADTATIQVADTQVSIGLYSPNKKLNAKQVAESLKEVLKAQEHFLKGKLPTDHYAFIIYLTDKPSNSGALGALEHWNSSFYFLPEESAKLLLPIIQEIASHEFFHILTPLSIHSEEIANFDYNQPEMSKHLWLYEGVTEYFAGLALVKEGVISQENYLNSILEKIVTSSHLYNRELAFTELSKKCLGEHSAQYANVYEKGALLAMGLDFILMSHTNGQYDLRDLMLDLSEKYGSTKPFKDDELFDIIGEISGIPEAVEYLEKYVDAPNPLPLTKMFEQVGILYEDEEIIETATFGNIGLSVNDNDEIFIEDITDMDEFGSNIGYQKGDVLLQFNTTDITLENISDIMDDFINHPEKFPKVKITVRRNGKIVKLKARTVIIQNIEENIFEKNPDCTPEQKQLRKVWLGNS
ncbi:M61 family metallopeptidase [Flammeovirga agarivorans]|uniref:Peptidase M61 n=1 Tax=Flammeovirga agarivorans TaxID=2726742 RepID=A0A7X8SL26_9BACT|nr:peptidase M61 [Flammeovirga agarivorans]NLR92203.1 peptidase M61 [Flammeovirga agarivorans]